MTPDLGLCGPATGMDAWVSLSINVGVLPGDDRLKSQLICTGPFLREGPSNETHGGTRVVLCGGCSFVKNVLAGLERWFTG